MFDWQTPCIDAAEASYWSSLLVTAHWQLRVRRSWWKGLLLSCCSIRWKLLLWWSSIPVSARGYSGVILDSVGCLKGRCVNWDNWSCPDECPVQQITVSRGWLSSLPLDYSGHLQSQCRKAPNHWWVWSFNQQQLTLQDEAPLQFSSGGFCLFPRLEWWRWVTHGASQITSWNIFLTRPKPCKCFPLYSCLLFSPVRASSFS